MRAYMQALRTICLAGALIWGTAATQDGPSQAAQGGIAGAWLLCYICLRVVGRPYR